MSVPCDGVYERPTQDLNSLDEELHGRIAQDRLQRLKLDGEPGRVTRPTLFGIPTRVEQSPTVFLPQPRVFPKGGRTVGHVESVGCGFHGVLKTGTVGGDVELDHVDGFRERSRVDLADDGEYHEDDRDEGEDGGSGDTVFSAHFERE